VRLLLAAAALHFRWIRRRSARLLAIPSGLLFVLLADRSGIAAAQVVAAVGPLAAFSVSLGYNDSRLRRYMKATTFGRPGAYRTLALEGWMAPFAAALVSSEGFALLLGATGAVAPSWQTYVALSFTSLAVASAAAFTRGLAQRLVAGFAAALIVLQLLLAPGTSPAAELLLPTAWPALSMSGVEQAEACFHADIYMGLSILLGVGVSLALGRGGMSLPKPDQLFEDPSQGG